MGGATLLVLAVIGSFLGWRTWSSHQEERRISEQRRAMLEPDDSATFDICEAFDLTKLRNSPWNDPNAQLRTRETKLLGPIRSDAPHAPIDRCEFTASQVESNDQPYIVGGTFELTPVNDGAAELPAEDMLRRIDRSAAIYRSELGRFRRTGRIVIGENLVLSIDVGITDQYPERYMKRLEGDLATITKDAKRRLPKRFRFPGDVADRPCAAIAPHAIGTALGGQPTHTRSDSLDTTKSCAYSNGDNTLGIVVGSTDYPGFGHGDVTVAGAPDGWTFTMSPPTTDDWPSISALSDHGNRIVQVEPHSSAKGAKKKDVMLRVLNSAVDQLT